MFLQYMPYLFKKIFGIFHFMRANLIFDQPRAVFQKEKGQSADWPENGVRENYWTAG